MKYISYEYQGRAGFGCVEGEHVIDLTGVDGCDDLKSYLQCSADTVSPSQVGRPLLALNAVTLLPVIPNPEKILCVGLNYESHRIETGMPELEHPVLFTRFVSTQVAHGEPIIRPNVSEKLDFEGELAVIIGLEGRHIKAADADRYIAGYSIYNDASIRDWQMHTRQFTAGKNFDHTGAFGPWLVTPDELTDLPARTITTRLNGNIVQHASFSDLIFDIPALIAYISTFCTLKPGDVIVTGTPGGVGVVRKPRLYMQPGDEVSVAIEGIGALTNPIEQESS